MLGLDLPVVDRLGDVFCVARPTLDVTESLPDPVQLAVADSIGENELAELLEHARRERLVPAQIPCLGDEAEQAPRVSGGECGHGPSKDMTNDEWTPVTEAATLSRIDTTGAAGRL